MDDPLFQTPCLPYDVLVEIIDIFLADLGDDDDQTYSLKLFAFLSRPILVFCQKRLFRKYDVGKVDGRLCRSILAHSPHLIAYVKEVWLYTGPTMPSLSSEEMSTIRKLTSVHHLFVGPRKFALWDCNVPFEEHQLITDLLRQPRITSFAVWGEMVPFLPLSKWRHLSAFEVRDENPYANFQDLDPERDSDDDSDDDIEDIYEDFNGLLLFEKALQAPQHSISIKLRKLCIIDSDKVLVHILLHPDHVLEHECNSSLPPDDPQVDRHDPADDAQHHFDFTQLRSLTADIMPANLLPIWHIIHQAHDHLRTLDIRERYRHRSPKDPFGFNSTLLPEISPIVLPDAISLTPLTNLHTLRITILIRDDLPAHPDALSSWCSLLRTAPPRIHTLEITLDAFYRFYLISHLTAWFPAGGCVEEKDGSRWSPLANLDLILASAGWFPALERVRVRVAIPEYARVAYSDSSDNGVGVDVVREEDMEEMRVWASEMRSRAASEMEVDVPSKDVDDPVSSSDDTRPTFSDDADSWTTREHPIDFDDVVNSISLMLSLTRQRFASTNAFTIDIDMGVPSTTQPPRTRFNSGGVVLVRD
ncbi:hypothetical protein BJ912DRAFT_235211 [Pholiota molesta]|nr:hypothetical protein BJ912DRAFT_235211 [Pholiota molesta]